MSQHRKYVLAGTGHRPPRLGLDYSDRSRDILLRFLLEECSEDLLGANSIISGMAQGFDQALARAVIELGIPLIATLPFEGQESKWPEVAQKDFHLILSKATEVKVVSAGEASAKKYYYRDRWMVDNAQAVLALLDNNPEKSGTRLTVEYALTLSKPVTNLWEKWETYRA